jgi:hypothetical protein
MNPLPMNRLWHEQGMAYRFAPFPGHGDALPTVSYLFSGMGGCPCFQTT